MLTTKIKLRFGMELKIGDYCDDVVFVVDHLIIR